MRRDRLDHPNVHAAREPERLPGASGDRERALGIRALGGDVVARARLDDRGGAAEGNPQAAEAPSAAAGGVEHAHVQARGRLDANRRHPPATAARTCRRTSFIASCSRGPAVLSTSTWRRSSSGRTSSAGSQRAREAMIDASRTA